MKKLPLILLFLIGCISPNSPSQQMNNVHIDVPATFSGVCDIYRNDTLIKHSDGISMTIIQCDSVIVLHQTGWDTDLTNITAFSVNKPTNTIFAFFTEDTITINSQNSITEKNGDNTPNSIVNIVHFTR